MSRTTRANVIRTALENDILTGALPPGAALDEERLAERFGVSRTPIREAVMQLLQDGLVEKEARRGTRVVKLDLHRLIQVFETTSELEGLCARFAARRIGKQELTELREAHALGERALKKGEAVEYARHGRHFHYLVIKASHNATLIETVNKIALHTLPYRRFQLGYEGRSMANHRDHSTILEAIANREDQLAYERMCSHVTVQGDVLADYISIGDRVLETG
jgi:DNA-binding GntR family transcriptional regulator